jgi:hypothetical protein
MFSHLGIYSQSARYLLLVPDSLLRICRRLLIYEAAARTIKYTVSVLTSLKHDTNTIVAFLLGLQPQERGGSLRLGIVSPIYEFIRGTSHQGCARTTPKTPSRSGHLLTFSNSRSYCMVLKPQIALPGTGTESPTSPEKA